MSRFKVIMRDGLPPSKKNKTIIAKRRDGRRFVMPNPTVRRYESHMKELTVLMNAGKKPISSAVHLDLVADLELQLLRVEAKEVDVPPSLRRFLGTTDLASVGGKRLPDLVNMLDLVADALEKVAYKNDRQIVSVTMRWL